jgi:hypothetical protein
MKIVEVKMKIACCYEVQEQIEEIVSSDEFAGKVRKAVADIVDKTTCHGKLDINDMTIEVGDDDVRVLYPIPKEERLAEGQ